MSIDVKSEFKSFLDDNFLLEELDHVLRLFQLSKDCSVKQGLLLDASFIAAKIPGLEGFPFDSKSFWDFESCGWTYSVPRGFRFFIQKKLFCLSDKGLNLSLGSGSCPYFRGSVLLDISEKMLFSYPAVQYDKKVVHDLNKGFFPFKDDSFDSVTMVFLLNYLKHPKKVLQEARRVLKKDGKIFIVQLSRPLNDLYKVQEKQFFGYREVSKLLRSSGFSFTLRHHSVGDTELFFVKAE